MNGVLPTLTKTWKPKLLYYININYSPQVKNDPIICKREIISRLTPIITLIFESRITSVRMISSFHSINGMDDCQNPWYTFFISKRQILTPSLIKIWSRGILVFYSFKSILYYCRLSKFYCCFFISFLSFFLEASMFVLAWGNNWLLKTWCFE